MANALLFVDGFDHETNGFGNADLLTKWSGFTVLSSGNPFGIDNTVAAFNGSSLEGNPAPGGNNGAIYKSLVAPLARVVMGFSFNPVANAAVGWQWSFPAVPILAANNCGVVYNGGNQALDIYNSLGVKVASTANGSVPVGTFTYIEFDITFNAGAGIINCNINGAVAVAIAGQNTGNLGNACQSFAIIQNNTHGGSHWDDLYMLDPTVGPYNGMLGGCRVQTLYPTANDVVQWNPNAGTNFSEVNAPQFNNGATFNSTPTVTDQDSLDCNALYTIPLSTFSVAITGAFAEDTGGAGIAVKNLVISGGTTGNGASVPVPNGPNIYAYDQDIFDQDPHINAAWQAATVNAMKIGYNRTA